MPSLAIPADLVRLRLLESAVVNSYDSFVITDTGSPEVPHPRIIYVNDAFTRLTGYTMPEALGRSPALLQGPASDRGEIGRMRTAIERGEAFTSELLNYRKDGTTYVAEVRIMPIRDADGRLTHWVGVQRDVSERRRVAEERARMESRMQETQQLESLGVLAGGIAHDFNNLLTVIVGSSTLARLELGDDDEIRRHLQRIDTAAQRAADLCRQMLAYSGKGRYQVQTLDFNAVVRETAELGRNAITAGHEVRLELAASPVTVTADASQMQQVLMNLLLNADEAIGPAAGTIRIATQTGRLNRARLARTHLGPELPDGDYAMLEVADTGGGIAPEIAGRIFDPFFTTKFTGRGLGLSAVLGVVRAHGGTIEVESRPGAGATFRVFLPAVPAEPAPAAPRPAAVPGSGAGRVVLVVDDDAPLRLLAVELLRMGGYKTLTAADGVEAVERFREHAGRIDAVLLDLSMPRMDGAAAGQEIRRLAPGMPVLLMSGFSEDEALRRFPVRERTGFLQKPFSSDALLGKLGALLAEKPAAS